MIASEARAVGPSRLEGHTHDRAPAVRFVAHERRHRERVSDASLAVGFKGETHTAVNWSLGGFVVENYRGSLTAGALLTIDGVGKAGGQMTEVAVRGRVVRVDRTTHILAVNFLGLDERAYAVLHDVMSDRMRMLTERKDR